MSDRGTREVRVCVTPESGEPSTCTLTDVRWAIIRRADSALLYCRDCESVLKSYRTSESLDEPYTCPRCYQYMDLVKEIHRLDTVVDESDWVWGDEKERLES